MKTVIYIIIGLALIIGLVLIWKASAGKGKSVQEIMQQSANFYDYSATAIDGKSVLKMSDYKGKKILVVNVASKCGYTPQYEGLEKLYEKYSDRLVIIGFPCNQFLGQEPGSNDEVEEFCKVNYGVTFPLAAKIKVKGVDQHPIYTWLTNKDLNGLGDFKISWNFNKFLISENGELLAHFDTKVKPESDEIISWLEQ